MDASLRAHYGALLRLPLKVAPAEAKVLAWHLVALASDDGRLDRTETLEELARAVGMLGRGKYPGRQAGDWLLALAGLGFVSRRKVGAVWHTTLTPGSTRLAEVSRLAEASSPGKADDTPPQGVSSTSPGLMTSLPEADAPGGGFGGVVSSNSPMSTEPDDGARHTTAPGAPGESSKHDDDERAGTAGAQGADGRGRGRAKSGQGGSGGGLATGLHGVGGHGQGDAPHGVSGVAQPRTSADGDRHVCQDRPDGRGPFAAPSMSDKPVSMAGGGAGEEAPSGADAQPHGEHEPPASAAHDPTPQGGTWERRETSRPGLAATATGMSSPERDNARPERIVAPTDPRESEAAVDHVGPCDPAMRAGAVQRREPPEADVGSPTQAEAREGARPSPEITDHRHEVTAPSVGARLGELAPPDPSAPASGPVDTGAPTELPSGAQTCAEGAIPSGSTNDPPASPGINPLAGGEEPARSESDDADGEDAEGTSGARGRVGGEGNAARSSDEPRRRVDRGLQERVRVGSGGPAGGGGPDTPIPALALTPPEPTKGRRKAKPRARTALTHERLRVIVATYAALGTARLQAGMPAPHAVPYTLRSALEEGRLPELTADAAALLRCIVQLEEGAHGEPMPLTDGEALLVATVKAKVAEHARRDDDFATGKHATIGTLVVRSNFAKWLASGRAWLASGGRPTSASKRVHVGIEGDELCR